MNETTATDRQWTVAYRKPTANRFLRVDLELTWHQARDLAALLVEALPGQQVYYIPNAASDASGRTPAEDAGNILTETGARVRVREGGVLPDGIDIPAAADAQAAFEDGADDATPIEDEPEPAFTVTDGARVRCTEPNTGYTGLYGNVATAHAITFQGEKLARVIFDNGETGYLPHRLLVDATAPAPECPVSFDGSHTWINLSFDSHRPDSLLGCQHCPARSTGAEQAAARGYVLLTKANPAYRIHAVDRFTLRGDLLAVAGSLDEAAAAVHRRAEEGTRAAVWAGAGNDEHLVYAPSEPGVRRLVPAPRIPAPRYTVAV